MPSLIQPNSMHDPRGAPPPVARPAADSGLGFDDLVDIVNPLQHIPVIGSIYRAISDDEISPVARVAGGTLFGGVTGFLGAMASELYAAIAGESVEDTVVSLFTPSGRPNGAQGQQAYLTQQSISNDEIERRATGALPHVSIML